MLDEEPVDDARHHDTIHDEGDVVAHEHGGDVVVRVVIENGQLIKYLGSDSYVEIPGTFFLFPSWIPPVLL